MSSQDVWRRPSSATLKFDFRIGESVLIEFARAHDPAAILRELIQNEYDAGGSRLEVSFGDDGLTIKGNGAPVDRKGWLRLSVVMGTGRIGGSNDVVRPKVNGIGEKNFGLRSLFVIGDELWIRSNGWQTVLHCERGSLPHPIPDPWSKNTPGIHIFVPYRTKKNSRLNPFKPEVEAKAFDKFTETVSPALLKLAEVNTRKSLREMVVSSSRHERTIEWKQTVRTLRSLTPSVILLSRRVQMIDSKGKAQTIEELEWQQNIRLPSEFNLQSIPSYFRRASRLIRLGVSLRTNRGRLWSEPPEGILYYPIGLPGVYTGNAVSLNAPFDMDFDRSLLNDPSNSAINAWLLENLAKLTQEMLKTDWLRRFGAKAYLAVGQIEKSSVPDYANALSAQLRTAASWPIRSRQKIRKTKLKFESVTALNVPVSPGLDDFLSDQRYLHSDLATNSNTSDLALAYGAKRFSLNSLIRLFCAGKDSSNLKTKLAADESNYYYTNYPGALNEATLYAKILKSLDDHWQELSHDNHSDLRSSRLLSSTNELRAANELWIVPPEIENVCPLPPRDRIHPKLAHVAKKRNLCTRFDSDEWVRQVATRALNGLVNEEERIALYKFILSRNGRFSSRTRVAITKAPIVLDHRNHWTNPNAITVNKTLGAREIKAVLHLPNREFAHNVEIANLLRFKRAITGEDLIAYARLVAENVSLAPAFERTLLRFRRLLTNKVVRQLHDIAFLLSNKEELRTPCSLYVRNSLNEACLGSAAAYVKGEHNSLYRLLGCKESPDVDGIIDYLLQLSGDNLQPPNPERLYSQLVRSLLRNGRSSTALRDENIMWNGSGYSAPVNTLVGDSYTKFFIGYLPCVRGLIPIVRDAYVTLGASTKPQPHHWRQLLISIGEEYSSTLKPLSIDQRNSVRAAYKGLNDISILPDDIPWLLDQRGRLHSLSAARSSSFLIDDEPALSAQLDPESSEIAFADISTSILLAFFNMVGVKSLSQVRQRVRQNIGAERNAPSWFDAAEILDGFRRETILDAIETITLHNLRTWSSSRERSQAATRKLRLIKGIEFVERLSASYRIGDSTVSVPTTAAYKDQMIYLTFVRSRSEMNGLLAGLIAEQYLDVVSDQRTLADAVYRLLSSGSDKERQEYLNSRGIRTKISSRANEDEDNDQAEVEQEQSDETIRSALLLRYVAATNEPAKPIDRNTPIPRRIEPEPVEDEEESTPLPSLEDVTPQLSDPTPGWKPKERRSGGGGGSGTWNRPFTARDLERDDAVGRRGEEIILRFERERVRELGFPEDRVRWISEEIPTADFDILSVDDNGEDLIIEVKSTTGSDGRFHWSRAEFQRAVSARERYLLYRVYLATSYTPIVRSFRDPIATLANGIVRLDVEVFHGEVEPI